MENDENLTLYNIPENVGSYPTIYQRGMESARLNDTIYTLPKVLQKFLNLLLPKLGNENENESDDLQSEGLKVIIPSNIFDNCTRFEVFSGLKLCGHTDTLTEDSNLMHGIYKRVEV